MAERLKKLKRLRETWAQRKRSTEYRIAAIATAISQANVEENYLVECLDGDVGPHGLFPDFFAQRLHVIANQKVELNRKMDSVRLTHRHDSLNLRRCEILEERQKFDLDQKEEAASLESIIEVLLLRKP